MHKLFLAAVAVACAAAPGAASAQLATKQVLTLEAAGKMIVAAQAEATRNGWRCVVAVVDDGGWLVALQRMDDTPMLVNVELAPAKARAAAGFGKPTQALEEEIDKGRFAQVTAQGFTQLRGGLPVVVGGRVVGAIGVSADNPDHDQQIAEAGVRAVVP